MSSTLPATDPRLNVAVVASAGTGKTWLLVTRIVRLLLEDARPDGILAITFTRKAAGEMQQRLSERLLALAACDADALDRLLEGMGVVPSTATRRRARDLYERLLSSERPANTTTFHAFCQDVLRRFPLDADVAPGFELLERTAGLEQAAVRALFAEATADPDGAAAQAVECLLDSCGGLQNAKDALQDFLDHRSDWWAFAEDRDDPVGYAIARLSEQLQIDAQGDALATLRAGAARAELEEFAGLLARGARDREQAQAQHLLSALREPDPERCLQQLREVFFTRRNSPRPRRITKTRAAVMSLSEQQRLLGLNAGLCGRVDAAWAQRGRLATWHSSSAWYRAGHRLLEHYQRIKGEHRLLDFADLEWRAYRLLTRGANAQWMQYKLDARIDHVLVDEFQDTNPTQWRLLLPLLEELAAGTQRPRSVFLVGDPKQSIYRFRRADPRLLASAGNWVTTKLGAQSFPLHLSRRSAPAIIEFVNRVFGRGPLAERLPDFQPHGTHEQELWGAVELLPLVQRAPERPATPPALRNPLAEPRVPEEDRRHLREGQLIAERIRALLDDGTPMRSGGSTRPIDCGDIFVLLRTRTHAHAYEAALRGAAIPYIGADRGTLLDSQEVLDLQAVLETLTAPYRDLALVTALRCPLFAATDEDLMRLASAPMHQTWCERLTLLAPEQPAGSPLQRAHHWLTRWRALAGYLPVHDLLDRIYCEGNVLERFGAAAPDYLGRRVVANLVRFLELSLEIDSGRYPSIPQFLEHLRAMRQHSQDAPDEGPAPASESRVRVMTIHAAKGLEAPVVFLADAAQAVHARKAYQALVDWPPEAGRPASLLLSRKREAEDDVSRRLREVQAQAEQREDANLLYVALTRARQYLFISGCASRQPDLGWYGHVASAFDLSPRLITTSLTVAHSGPPPAPVSAAAPAISPGIEPDPRLAMPIGASMADTPHSLSTGAPVELTEPAARQRDVAVRRALQLLTEPPQRERDALRRELAHERGLAAPNSRLIGWWEEACAVVDHAELRTMFDSQRFETAYNAVPLHYSEGGRTVLSTVDRLVVLEREVLLVDYETRRRGVRQGLPELAQAHAERLSLCAAAARRLWPDRTPRALVVFTAIPALHPLAV